MKELTPEALAAWQRSMNEIEQRSQVCSEAAGWNWGGRPPLGRPEGVRSIDDLPSDGVA